MTATPAPKFPLPFANRRPQFVPHSIDPKVPFSYYPAWGKGAPRKMPGWVIVSMWIAGCALATVPYWLMR